MLYDKILLVYGYSAKNAGDLAITIGTLDVLSNLDNEITVVSRYSENDKQYVESKKYLEERYRYIRIKPSPFELDRRVSKLKLFRQYIAGFLKIVGLKRDCFFRNKMSDFDKLYFNGGNLLRCSSITDFIRLIALMYPLKIAVKLNIPIIILPQSTTKINWIGKRILGSIVNNTERIYCREKLTYNVLKKYFKKSIIYLNTDLAFFINHNYYKIKSKTKKIAITTRSQIIGDIRDLPEIKKSYIKEQLIKLINKLLDQHCHVCFVVQTQADYLFTRNIYDLFASSSDVNFFESYDPLKLIEYYSTCDILIGMRLHSIILALSAGTTCIGYFDKSWGLKGPGILTDYKQDYAFIGEEEKLLALVEKNLESDPCKNEKDILSKIEKFKSEMFFE
jgi:polysaccharide pyruvyl transferase WcaK-like protein